MLIDYSKYDEIFDNLPEPQESPFSELEQQKREFAIENALKYEQKFEVPEVADLTPKVLYKAPSTAQFWRRVVCKENNGRIMYNSRKFMMKACYWAVFPALFWGMTFHVTHGIYLEEFNLFSEPLNIYDKLHERKMPYAQVWSRPG